jgi:hypothetical protein
MERIPLPSSKLDQALEKIEGLSTDDMRTLIVLLEQKISESGNGNKTQGSLAIDSNETSEPLPISSNEYNGIDAKDFEKLKISRQEIRKLCAEWHELPPNSYLRADMNRI